MQIPPKLGLRWGPARRIDERGDGSGSVWILENHPGRALKLSARGCHIKEEVLTRLQHVAASYPTAAEALALPQEVGWEDGVFYQITEYFPAGTVADQSTRNSGSPLLRQLVQQLHSSIALLHLSGVLHADIKPANIFLRTGTGRDPTFVLGDFNSAVFLQDSQSTAPLLSYTVRYAAPEVLGRGRCTIAADWWSLGMVILEAIGSHPLASLPEQELRSLLVTGWKPDFAKIEDTQWRALIGGLMRREPDVRWRSEHVARWLQNDSATISAGLVLAGESATETPFSVMGNPVYSAPDLARALLRQWSPLR